MKNVNMNLHVVPIETSDRAIAEYHGFSVLPVEQEKPAGRRLRVVNVRVMPAAPLFRYVGPAGGFGPEVSTEDEAWKLAAAEARIRGNEWGNWCRSRRVEVVTDKFVPLDERPLFGDCEDEGVPTSEPDKVLSEQAAKNTELVARTRRLEDQRIRNEIVAKGLPEGREANLALLKKLLAPKEPN